MITRNAGSVDSRRKYPLWSPDSVEYMNGMDFIEEYYFKTDNTRELSNFGR